MIGLWFLKIGDTAFAKKNDQEIAIIAPLKWRSFIDNPTGKRCTGFCYIVAYVDNPYLKTKLFCAPWRMYKKKPDPSPPATMVVPWNECEWSPHEAKEHVN